MYKIRNKSLTLTWIHYSYRIALAVILIAYLHSAVIIIVYLYPAVIIIAYP